MGVQRGSSPTASKKKQRKKVKNQIQAVEHQQTTQRITTLAEEGMRIVVIGDGQNIRHHLDAGSQKNQKLHQWFYGPIRHLLTSKAQRRGMSVVLQEEKDISRTCPACGHRKKSSPQGRQLAMPEVPRPGLPRCSWSQEYSRQGSWGV